MVIYSNVWKGRELARPVDIEFISLQKPTYPSVSLQSNMCRLCVQEALAQFLADTSRAANMGVDAGFDMVPRLSRGVVDTSDWDSFISLLKRHYRDDPQVEIKPNYILFKAGEYPMLPFEGHKFLRFSSKVSGKIATETGVENYIDTIKRVARARWGSRVRYWHEGADQYGYYDWEEVHESFRSYEQVRLIDHFAHIEMFHPFPPILAHFLIRYYFYSPCPQPDERVGTTSIAHFLTGIDTNDTMRELGIPLFEIKKIPGKGRGLVARFDISKGTQILCEKPLLTAQAWSPKDLNSLLAAKLKAMPKAKQLQFLSLHNNFPGKLAFSGIMRTNALPCGSGSPVGGVYPTICLINHSCLPNAHNSWDGGAEHEVIYAVRPIRAGEEITNSYDHGGPSPARRAHLKENFGFECACGICSLPAAELRASDARRLRIQKLDEKIGDPFSMEIKPAESLKHCHTLLRALEEEFRGHAGAHSARLYYDAFQVCIVHGDQARASVFAEKAYRARASAEGEDSPEAQRMRSLSLKPAGHISFGMYSMKWESARNALPRGLDTAQFESWLFRERA